MCKERIALDNFNNTEVKKVFDAYPDYARSKMMFRVLP